MAIGRTEVHSSVFCSKRRPQLGQVECWLGSKYTCNHDPLCSFTFKQTLLPAGRQLETQVDYLWQVQSDLEASFPGSAQGNPIFKDSSEPKVLLIYYHPQHDTGAVCLFFRNWLHWFLPNVKRCPAVWKALRREKTKADQRRSGVFLQVSIRGDAESAPDILPSLWPNTTPTVPVWASE